MFNVRAFSLLIPVVALLACKSGKGSIDTDGEADTADDGIGSADDIEDLCAQSEPETLVLTVEFPALDGGCPWGSSTNLEEQQGVITARIEQVGALDVPADVVVCDVGFDFQALNGGTGTPMYYDDNFIFTFNDVVLAASYGPMVDVLEIEDGVYAQYDWSDLRGYEISFDDSIPSYCLGEDQDLADCTIPLPETDGLLALEFDSEVARNLAYRALQEQRYDFMFITMGDNDSTDCAHETFGFEVEVPFVRL